MLLFLCTALPPNVHSVYVLSFSKIPNVLQLKSRQLKLTKRKRDKWGIKVMVLIHYTSSCHVSGQVCAHRGVPSIWTESKTTLIRHMVENLHDNTALLQ